MTTIAMWGSSLGVRIPKVEAERAGFSNGTEVEIVATGREIVIKKAGPRYSLESLVSRITPDNLHSEMDFGPSVGNEHW